MGIPTAILDPTATLAVQCGKDFDAGLSLKKITRLLRQNAVKDHDSNWFTRPTERRVILNPYASILFPSSFDMETVQYAVKDWR